MWCLWPFFFFTVRVVSGTLQHEYTYISKSTTWAEAQNYCRKHHTDLATISSASDLSRSRAGAWIGLNNYERDSRLRLRWRWSGRERENGEVEGDRWSPGEPNDDTGKENCVSVQKSMRLSDQSCCSPKPFICYDEQTNRSEIISVHMTWSEAVDFCRRRHSDLLSGWTRLDDPVLRENISRSADSSWWVGLFRDPWSWSDTSNSSYRNWHHDDGFMCEDVWRTYGQCVRVGREGEWRTDKCTEKKPFICYDSLPSHDPKMILVRKSLTWEEALDYCEHHHKDLLSVTSRRQHRRAQRLARQAQGEAVWLGAEYTCLLELWMWTSVEFVVHEDWKGYQESECGQAVAMETKGRNRWVKRFKEKRYNFICVQ
ncbi:hypothetical protein WMY93_000110 [Mugilogobius chulae]|uniref:C-type lectin domain-containing protein n=1 Tax=Mugilogobius chulae TaxID=88201 RepID=A0AAW0Q938_9GOBI